MKSKHFLLLSLAFLTFLIMSCNKDLENNNVIEQEYKAKKIKNFTAETDSSYWNPYSNVALLHDL